MSIFDKFTNQYALSKTLRFELKPIGGTLEHMRSNLQYDPEMQTFLKDQWIEDAYQALKPVLDKLHEDFITQSLESKIAKQIVFSNYFEQYKAQTDDKREKDLRDAIGKSFVALADEWKINSWKTDKGKDFFKESGYKILTENGILVYIKEHANDFLDILSKDDLLEALGTFDGFFTYFVWFNQNRENYYDTKDEKWTAVATRVVHENLPKFCDNIILYDARAEEYSQTYAVLQSLGKSLINKEGKNLFPISSDIFHIGYFSFCLSQREIEAYNEKIGNANFLINLYNQAKGKEVGFKKLSSFKTLYKQIWCGKKKSLFFALTHDSKTEAEKVRQEGKEAFSVEEVLLLAQKAGENFFQGKSDDGAINTVPEFLEYLLQKESYEGVYWSKSAMNTISNKYFANYHDLKDRLRNARVFEKAKKGSEDDAKIPEAIELLGLFAVLDATDNWQTALFKNSILEDKEKISVIKQSKTASDALLRMIFSDIKENIKGFSEGVKQLKNPQEYKSKESKEAIKKSMDYALTVQQMLKYFVVKESKIKGTPIDSALAEGLKNLIFEAKLEDGTDVNWFKWYDALRNYLTKKPQDDAKANKLKLNFENGSLLGWWSDGQEKIKGAVLLRKDGLYYLGILKKKNIFNTEEGKGSEVYKAPSSESGRLILANLKFQTLAWKGFLGEFKKFYGEMGKEDSQHAIACLQKIIKDRYVKRYPLLERIANTWYSDKKSFDKDIQETLKECYVCEFTPVNWVEIERYTESGQMYLFQISSKDLGEKATGNKNLQTLYWDAVFEENSPFQLSGGGEIFYRKQAIREKKEKKGYEGKGWIIENKRFAEENGKFLFHCPIKLNYKALGNSNPKYALSDVNKSINEKLYSSDSLHFLGIDRGEKHLAYFSLVNQEGKIIDQGTLNLPFIDKNGNPRVVKAEKRMIGKDGKEALEILECRDYNELLEARAGDRDFARKNWQTIGTIKELKEGYVSQVVRQVADLSVKHGAFIVLEDLNTGFKRGRQKIEKSVYQKFEVALAKKLNFLVDKKAKNGELGSVTRALQLTPPVSNYWDIENKKQVWIMLYTRANYTSQTDPQTGWRKSIYLRAGSEENIKEQVISFFSDIRFDGKDYVFEYVAWEVINYETGEIIPKVWKLYSGIHGVSLDRFRWVRGKDKNEWRVEKIDIVKILDGVFRDFDKSRSLLSQIIDDGMVLTKTQDHTAWESLRFAIDLIQQIRNSGVTDRDGDFLLSPVRDEHGDHFDSRVYWDMEKRGEKIDKPSSGDANGAFNIARKGLLMNEHIKTNPDPKDLNLFISEEEWDLYLTDETSWRAKLSKFSSRKQMEKMRNSKKS